MKGRITGVTVDYDKLNNNEYSDYIERTNGFNILSKKSKLKYIDRFIKESFGEFSGKNAGICYMSKPYDELSSEDSEKSINRFKRTIQNTHHSIADHCYITVVFEEVPKFFAMIMNSFQAYATSEKSARYTVMENLSQKENRLYNKWIKIFKNILIDEKGLNEKDATKIAQENARYFISIFSPSTTFSYTTSLRQWNYIYDWFHKFTLIDPSKELEDNTTLYGFYKRTVKFMDEFQDWFGSSMIYEPSIVDPKSRIIDFIPQLYPGNNERIYQVDVISDVYSVRYEVSFAALAQLQRHRSIKYVINDFTSRMIDGEFRFILPEILEDKSDLVREWMNDMRSIDYLYPQGLVVEVAELGTIDKFLLKCDERLCGRTQLETMKCCSQLLTKFASIANMTGSFSPYFRDIICNKWVTTKPDGTIVPKVKCQVRADGCSDSGCIHGPTNALTRDF